MIPTTRLIFAAAFAVLPAAAAAGLVPGLAGVCALVVIACACAAVVDAVICQRRLGTVQVQTPAYLRVTKDVPALLNISFENRAQQTVRLKAGIVMPVGVQSEKLTESIDLPAGKSALAWPCMGLKRGDHRLEEVHLETGSPLGFWLARGRRAASCDICVYPNLRDRATAALFLRSPEAGARVLRQLGKGREFERLREYMPGDNYEDIHWKATARRGVPITKLYQVEHAQEVYLVVDCSRLSAREEIIESYVSAALHLALVAQRQGDRFGLITFSDRPHSLVRARNGMDHFRLCRETIYNLHARRVSPDFRDLFTSIQLNLRRRALLIFFTSLDDPLLAETFEREVSLIARRHVVLVNVIETRAMKPLFQGPAPDSTGPVFDSLAGQVLWNKMRKLEISLHNRGVRLTVVDPARIKAQAAAKYLEIKRRQLL